MLAVNECVLETQQMVIVVFVQFGVKLVKVSISCQRRLAGAKVSPSRKFVHLTKSRTDTSIMLWLKYAVRFLMTLTATTS